MVTKGKSQAVDLPGTHIITVGSEKGGTGKTTLATNIAAMRAMAGYDVLLVDTDIQQSASFWAGVRAENPNIAAKLTCVSKQGKIGYDLLELKKKFHCIIVDAGGRDSLELRQAVLVSDQIIIPIRTGQFDTWTITRMAQILDDSKVILGGVQPYARTLLNAANTNPAVNEIAEAREYLEDYKAQMPLLDTVIFERIVYRRTVRDGMGVAEVSGAGRDAKAVQELAQLYAEIFHESFEVAA